MVLQCVQDHLCALSVLLSFVRASCHVYAGVTLSWCVMNTTILVLVFLSVFLHIARLCSV